MIKQVKLTIPANKILFEYRNNDLSDDLIFLSASFKGDKKELEELEEKMKELKIKKNMSETTRIKTSGSTFKNPIKQTTKKVWELIKESVSLDNNYW